MILNGLRRALRSQRAEWDVLTASGGREALDILGHTDIDVIVSDIRMPGMMGYDLLEDVRKRHARVIRLALSGQAADGDVDKCVGPVHQFLSKPCEAEPLKAILARTRVLMDMPVPERIKGAVNTMEALPSLPQAYDSLQHELESPTTTTSAVAATVLQDIGMSLRTLQLVSSSFYAAPAEVASPARQIEFLGLDVLRRLACSPTAFRRCARPEGENFSLARQCGHGRTVARFARRIMEMEGAGPDAADEAYVAGLVHHVGKVVFMDRFPDEYDEALSLGKEQGIPPSDAETQVFQATHAAVGAYLLGLWGLPDAVVRAASWHHCPIESPGRQFDALTAVHAADVFAHEIDGACYPGLLWHVDKEYLSELGLMSRLPVWRENCLESAHKEMVNV